MLARRQDDGQQVFGIFGKIVEGEVALAFRGRAIADWLSSRDSRL